MPSLVTRAELEPKKGKGKDILPSHLRLGKERKRTKGFLGNGTQFHVIQLNPCPLYTTLAPIDARLSPLNKKGLFITHFQN